MTCLAHLPSLLLPRPNTMGGLRSVFACPRRAVAEPAGASTRGGHDHDAGGGDAPVTRRNRSRMEKDAKRQIRSSDPEGRPRHVGQFYRNALCQPWGRSRSRWSTSGSTECGQIPPKCDRRIVNGLGLGLRLRVRLPYIPAGGERETCPPSSPRRRARCCRRRRACPLTARHRASPQRR